MKPSLVTPRRETSHTELDGSGIFLGSQQDAVRFDVPMNDVILVTVTHCF